MLENHLKTTHAKATYISNTIQEEIIECCKEEILSKILANVQSNKFYSIMFDETTDISNSSQMCLVLKNIHQNSVLYWYFKLINCILIMITIKNLILFIIILNINMTVFNYIFYIN